MGTQRRDLVRGAGALLALGALARAPRAQDGGIALPPPQTRGGRPLMEVLQDRRSQRDIATTALPAQTLSNLLWAAFGINRPDGHRTAPSARNWQEIDVHVVLAEGAFVYGARAHRLRPVAAGDHRAAAGTQSHARRAPVTLVYVADETRMRGADAAARIEMAAADTGFIAQNVYLVCASAGLATVVFASIDRPRLAAALKLAPTQRIVLAQSVGDPEG